MGNDLSVIKLKKQILKIMTEFEFTTPLSMGDKVAYDACVLRLIELFEMYKNA